MRVSVYYTYCQLEFGTMDSIIESPQMQTHASIELLKLRDPDGNGIYASADQLYRYAIFGRDSVVVGIDRVPFEPELPREIILNLARFQGQAKNPTTEEEPGRIHHEYRSSKFNNGDLPESSKEILKNLSQKWGGTEDEMIYFGSVDATPMYVRLVVSYVNEYGPEILNEKIENRLGQKSTIGDSIEQAVRWIETKIGESSIGLIEYKRSNPKGIRNQVWKDSETSYVHLDGSIANVDDGIAACEVQAYAYDALLGMAALTKDADRTNDLHTKATALRDSAIEHLWMEDVGMFAMGIDFHNGKPRQIKTPSSNSGLMLDSEILLHPHPEQRERFRAIAKGIAATIMSTDFLTLAGIRCRALSATDLIDYPDYHGSYVVWPKETAAIGRGMFRHGFTEHGDKLMQSVKASVGEYGFREFFYVDNDGNILDPQDPNSTFVICSDPKLREQMSHSEKNQAWTISAALLAESILN